MKRKRSDPPLSSLGERGFLKKFLPRFARFQSTRFIVPVGDDAAVLKGPGRPVLSIDGLTEGTHFKSTWDKRCRKTAGFSLAQGLGWKLLGSSLSDLAAMGKTKNRWAMIYLGAPGNVRENFLSDLYQGVHAAAQKYDCALAGGDTVKANDISLVCAVGAELVGNRTLLRGGARPGDWLCIAGTVGDAEIGLAVLQEKIRVSPSDSAYFIRRFFRHEPLFRVSSILAETTGVTSLIDLSDALGDTLKIVCETSRVGAWMDLALVPVSRPYKRLFKNDQRLLSGGEDYALLFTAASSVLTRLKRTCAFSVIGRVQKKSAGIRYLASGRPLKAPHFFEHFR